ncbi:MAG: UDP-N-acetylmuramoyl-tripeptide--D-alanyl-D-alanine ligase [Actinobacteria bacterium]|nr:UDP-N-acetylmuramoyl-tripeptide--D-alanyl-D-alanine ligase [Actinomycetota bacterium]
MIARPLSEIADAVHGRIRGRAERITSVVTDSRRAAPGALFVALQGERVDGHAFVTDALARGAAAALVHREVEGEPLLVVADTGRALLALAADERDHLSGTRVIAITGANGKTSTKDLTAAVCRTAFRTHASPASFNNEVGLPMTLLTAEPRTEVVVAEMGARREGDVALLCRIARPEVVVVTNVGVAHMEIFGSWDAIVRAGAEPVEWLDADGVAIVNAEDPVTRGYRERARARVVTFGTDPNADVRAEDVVLGPDARANFTLRAGSDRARVELGVPGEHMVSNALAAAACGVSIGIDVDACAAALEDARISPWRMETFETASGVTVLNDAYNANPESMSAALKTARWMASGRRLAAVLGHMAELGPVAFEEHERLGELVVRIGVDRLITVGEPARQIARAAIREGQLPQDVLSFDEADGAADEVRAWARRGDVVLLKGSRVAGIERVAESLRAAELEPETTP